MVRGVLSDDRTIQLKVVTGALNSQKYQDQILESVVRPPLDSLDGQSMVCLFCLFVLLLYVPSQQLWSLRDGQFTLPHFFFLGRLEQTVNQ